MAVALATALLGSLLGIAAPPVALAYGHGVAAAQRSQSVSSSEGQTYTISGTVRGPDGTGLPSVGVTSPDDFGFGTSTGSDGTYSLTVIPGDYTLNFDDNTGAHVSGWYSSSGVNGFIVEGVGGALTPVSVTTANVTGIDVVMPIGWHLSGRVTGPDGTPLANIAAWAEDAPSQFMMHYTQADGTYSRTVLPGSYMLGFHDRTGIHVDGCYSASASGHFTPDRNACTLVSVTTADVTVIDVVMALGLHISGTVTGPGGTPLANIGVRAGTDTFEVWTNTGADGTYSLTVPAGDYMLSFHDDSSTYVDGCYSSDGFTTDQSLCTPLGVPPDLTGIDVVMPQRGSANKLLFDVQPNNPSKANIAITPAFTVKVADEFGNLVLPADAKATAPITIKIASGPSGALPVGTLTVNAFGGVATFADVALDSVGTYTLSASSAGLTSATSASFVVGVGNRLTTVVTSDAEFKHIDGFDVLFGKGSTSSSLKLKNTNPGTLHYELEFTNDTGVALNYDNSATASIILTVPGLPTNVGVTIPSSITTAQRDVAFTVQGNRSVKAHPNDKTDELPISVMYATSAPAGNCYDTAVAWSAGQPTDGTAVRCIKVSGFAVPKKHSARLEVNLEFRYKNTDGWGTSAETLFRAGFAFKSRTTIALGPSFPTAPSLANTKYIGSQVAGIVGSGQQVTAVGGFVFDTSANGVDGTTVKLYNAYTVGMTCASPGAAAQAITQPDGFYLIWKAGADQENVLAANLASGIRYYAVLCSQSSPPAIAAARYIDHKLANKEFLEEDFYITVP